MDFAWENLEPLLDLDCAYADEFQHIFKKTKAELPTNLPAIPQHVKWGEDISHVFNSWRNGDGTPSLPALLLNAAHHFDLDMTSDLFSMALTACMLGEIPHENPYHNNHHFREVFFLLVHLCDNHNEIEKNPAMALNHDDILTLLATAAIHDFAHKGQGNIIDGMHIQSYVEKQSIEKSKPFFNALGIDNKLLSDIGIMILCTDVSRSAEGQSPAEIARDVYLAHQHDNLSIVTVDDLYAPIIESSKLSLMTILLCEADIAMSSGLDYDFSKKMTKLVADESSVLQPNAATLYGFMQSICHGGYLSRAAQCLLGQNFQGILLQAEMDSEKNISYAEQEPKRTQRNIIS